MNAIHTFHLFVKHHHGDITYYKECIVSINNIVPMHGFMHPKFIIKWYKL
jgi:hypothetical protein